MSNRQREIADGWCLFFGAEFLQAGVVEQVACLSDFEVGLFNGCLLVLLKCRVLLVGQQLGREGRFDNRRLVLPHFEQSLGVVEGNAPPQRSAEAFVLTHKLVAAALEVQTLDHHRLFPLLLLPDLLLELLQVPVETGLGLGRAAAQEHEFFEAVVPGCGEQGFALPEGKEALVGAGGDVALLYYFCEFLEPVVQVAEFLIEVVDVVVDFGFPLVEVDFVEHGHLEVGAQQGRALELVQVVLVHLHQVFRFLLLLYLRHVDEPLHLLDSPLRLAYLQRNRELDVLLRVERLLPLLDLPLARTTFAISSS